MAGLCPFFVFTQDADQGAQSTTEPNFSQEESQLRFDDGEDTAPDSEAIQPVAEFTIWDFVRMVLVLGFVVALIYGLFYLLKRAQGNQGVQSGVVDVLASQSLPGNGMVHLVKVGNQLFMLGSSEQSLRLLTEITDKESVDEVELRAARTEQPERRNFSDLMSSMLGTLAGRGSEARDTVPGTAPAEATEAATSAGTFAETGGGSSSAETVARSAPNEDNAAPRPTPPRSDGDARTNTGQSTAEVRAEREVLEFISSQRERLRRLNS